MEIVSVQFFLDLTLACLRSFFFGKKENYFMGDTKVLVFLKFLSAHTELHRTAAGCSSCFHLALTLHFLFLTFATGFVELQVCYKTCKTK